MTGVALHARWWDRLATVEVQKAAVLDVQRMWNGEMLRQRLKIA
jgi:hypothetical protein